MKIKTVIAGMFALAGILCWGDDIQYETLNGLTWSYTVYDGSATVYGGSFEEWDDEEGGYVEAFYPAIPDGTSGAIVVPSRLGGYPVTAIGDGAFCECYKLTSVTIPAGVVTIGEEAFTDCESMVGVTLPEGLQSIGDDAFDGCGKLRSVTLPESLTSIGSRAFDDCASLPSIRIPSKVKTIGYHSFARDYGLKTVEVPERLRAQITDNAVFYKCSPKITYYSSIPVITFDANGGKIGSQAKILLACEEENDDVCLYITPEDPVKAGVDFDGWWTAKDGGVQVQFGDVVDLSVFANAKTPTLYAQWRIAHKITVAGGFFDDETTARSGLYRGDEVGVLIDDNKLYDKNGNVVNAFANWTYTPATADLGGGFDPFSEEVTVTMPNADVKLTANIVSGFAAYLTMGWYQSGEAPVGDFYWSIDNGKTLVPMGYTLPVKAGKVKVKFYDKTGNWRASDMEFTVEKRGTYKEGNVTYYEDPWELYREAKFVPVNDSMKIKLDANGGTGSREDFFANGCEYLSYPTPYRKGYAFAGWWTAKDGGKLITTDMIFNPADFAGQKTPTLYAHWLQKRKLTMKDESAVVEWYLDSTYFDDERVFAEIVNGLSLWDPEFSDGGYLEGRGVLELLPGTHVNVSVASDSYDEKTDTELTFQKWTVSPSKANLGPDFRVTYSETEFTMPDADVTLQATYIDESTSGRLRATAEASSVNLGYDEELGEYAYIEPPYDAFEWSPDGGATWYKAGSGSSYWVEDGDGGYLEEDYGEYAMLKQGYYTVIWRSNDPCWQVPTGKTKVWVGDQTVYGTFTYVPQVTVDVMTFEDDELTESAVGGTVTMNPKDGLVPARKTIALAAKAGKDYVFQGWAFGKDWEYGEQFEETGATWKLENYMVSSLCSDSEPRLNRYIDPTDKKVHVVAVFKALSAYSADDIQFKGFAGYDSSTEATYDNDGSASVTVKAVVGCALDEDYALVCSLLAGPLTYKLDGKLPDGLKFDAKTGVLSGAPKKAGNTSVTITATDPAKNAKKLTVCFEVSPLPDWLVGEFRGMTREYSGGYYSCEWNEEDQDYTDCGPAPYVFGPQEGLLELTVKSDGKVSAKLLTSVGSRSVSGTLSWFPDEDDAEAEGTFTFTAKMTKDDEECDVEFYPDGTIGGHADSYSKSEDTYLGGRIEGMRQDTALLADSPFLGKYYTFAFCATTTESGERWDEDEQTWVPDESEMKSGYGYLTVKTDATGGAKVTGLLPDGEKVSMSALVMPFIDDDTLKAHLYVFASPSSYKKQDWFAMSLVIAPDGTIASEDGAAWTPANAKESGGSLCTPCSYSDSTQNAVVFGEGALYSEASSLEDYYWIVSCEWSNRVRHQFSYKDYYEDDDGKTVVETAYYNAEAQSFFDGFFFNVAVRGDRKGAISLAEKSPAPWEQTFKEDGETWKEWNYDEDKNGNEITDPSQLSISFTKATGIFTGKANAYFDYWQSDYKKNRDGEYEDFGSDKHVTASLPYSGVMIYDGEGGYVGFGSAVHTYKYSYQDDSGKAKSDTTKVTLPVSLTPSNP